LNSNRLFVIVVVVIVVLGAGITVALYAVTKGASSTSTSTSLPAGCTKPAGGFLIVASDTGYNDSMDHGVPAKSWPVINVTQGQTVNITVCNIDFQAHGFQVAHYYDNSIVTIAPGEVIHVSFVANQAGEFQIYCEIFCSIHWAMQSGLLRVMPT
jgi:hypothetical protein